MSGAELKAAREAIPGGSVEEEEFEMRPTDDQFTPRMSGRELKDYRRRKRLTGEALAISLGVAPFIVADWEKQPYRYIPAIVAKVLLGGVKRSKWWMWLDDSVFDGSHPQSDEGTLPDGHPLGPEE